MQSPSSRPPATGTLRQGVLASAAIPGVFPPVILAGETYVDGDVRNVLPIREALRIGTDSAYAISAGSPFMEAAPATYGRASMVEIAARSVDILVDEVALDDLTSQAP